MFDYRDAKFYSEYFSSLEGFSLLEEFKVSEDKNEENLYVGIVEVLNTIHPLVLRVEIPFTFPHNKLFFRTKSLSGYPHLIHTGKVNYGDWFCLNTPFAETPEEQLNQEVNRLKEWISHQMRKDLPPIIKDEKVKCALALANAYEWENPDEVKEFSSQAMLTFVGDFQNDIERFKENMGYLYCIKSPDNRFYAVSNPALSNCRLPYIIVDQVPKTLEDFVWLKEQYDWSEKTCEHLLPKFDVSGTWHKSSDQTTSWVGKTWEEQEALEQIEKLEGELRKDESYLNVVTSETIETDELLGKMYGDGRKLTKVLPAQKKIIIDEINSIRQSVKTEHKFEAFSRWPEEVSYNELTDEERDEIEILTDAAIDDYYSNLKIWHHFAFGIKCDGRIVWLILFTNHRAAQSEKIRFDLVLKTFDIERIVSQPMRFFSTQVVSQEMFFGRGAFSIRFKSKRVALVGLGAIGSMVASSLAHCGISNIGLWDYDIVEPGNICRSAYSIKNVGESKVRAIASIIKSINPYIRAEQICEHGRWSSCDSNDKTFTGGSFYANVNYKSQEEAIKELDDYDLVIDCTGSNEMLHFLSYAACDKEIVSMCITNHANDLLCISNKDGNPFELRKAYLSRIEQDTKNFYVEGQGCYSPTFLANCCDISSLVNLALRDLNLNIENGHLMHSSIYSYTDRGIVADRLFTYKLEGYDISLTISSEILCDAEEMDDSPNGDIGYVLGAYSKDGKQVMVTHIVDSMSAKDVLTDAYKTSKGIIDYIGDYRYSGEKSGTYNNATFELIASKAADESINTNNPLLAVRNPDGTVSFFLYINNELVRFLR